MPYKSEAQRKFFNSPAGKEKLGEEEVEHWNEVSKGMKLPEKAIDRAIRILDEREYRVVANPGFNKSTHPFMLQVKNALGWGNAGTFKTREEAEKAGKNY